MTPILVFLCFCFSLSTHHVLAQKFEGEDCNTKDGSAGTCKSVELCQVAKDDLRKGILPVICGFSERVPIVCCPLPGTPTTISTRPTTTTTTTTTTPSIPVTTRSKSRQMCQEYSSLVFVKTGVTVLFPNAKPTKEDQCVAGKTLIIGGSEALPKEFPHMAIIGFGEKDAISWGCGGSLISERFVLTAAHCLSQREWGKARWVRLGDLDIRRTDDNTQTQDFSIIEAIKHPNYKRPSHYNDIALLRLDRNVKFDGYVRPACLHAKQDIPNIQPEAIGWGRTDWVGAKGSDILLKVGLNFVNPEICNDTFSFSIGGSELRDGITENSMLCVGDLNGGKDTCKGDSGGPLHVRLSEPYCMFDIVGITSFGSICGSKNSPAVYTRVSNYIPWIESIVWS